MISYCGMKTKDCKTITIFIIRIQKWKNASPGISLHLRPRLGELETVGLLRYFSVKRDNEQYQVIRIETVGDKEEFKHFASPNSSEN